MSDIEGLYNIVESLFSLYSTLSPDESSSFLPTMVKTIKGCYRSGNERLCNLIKESLSCFEGQENEELFSLAEFFLSREPTSTEGRFLLFPFLTGKIPSMYHQPDAIMLLNDEVDDKVIEEYIGRFPYSVQIFPSQLLDVEKDEFLPFNPFNKISPCIYGQRNDVEKEKAQYLLLWSACPLDNKMAYTIYYYSLTPEEREAYKKKDDKQLN